MNIKSIINVTICVVMIVLVWVVISMSQEMATDKGNTLTLLKKTQDTENELNKKKQEIGLLKLTIEELEQYRSKYVETLNELNIRTKDVEELMSATSKAEQRYETILRDSVTLRYDTIKVYDYADDYTTAYGTITGDTIRANIVLTDTLTIIRHIERKKFLCIRYGKKSENMTVTNKNPNVQIKDVEIIEIIK